MASVDEKYMKIALALAKRGLGNVAPNPAVGCLIVKDAMIIGRGWTQPSGRPHAEAEALKQAAGKTAGATAYVTLEPCAHFGKTPPCAQELIDAGIGRVVIATLDPDSRVNGQGVEILQRAGVHVSLGILESEARHINRGFFLSKTDNRPFITAKTASTLDSKIATKSGESKWITGSKARQHGHLLRTRHDAILVGVNTVIADDPSLDCRITGLETCSPKPVILDSSLKTPLSSKILKRKPLIICGKGGRSTEAYNALKQKGGQLIIVDDTREMKTVCRVLATEGITRLLVEGGAQVITSFLKAGFVDDLLIYMAPKLIGADGISAIAGMGLAELVSAPHFNFQSSRRLGADLLACYQKAE